MKVYYFTDTDWKKYFNVCIIEMADVLKKVTTGTKTDRLILALYLIGKSAVSSGVAYVQNWMTQNQFISCRGRWRFTKYFPIPEDLPEKFKLIRLKFGGKNLRYPLYQEDRYGWKLTYKTFIDHLAFLFAHELHHFRRYHHGLHPHEGENTANKWAIQMVQKLNFNVEGEKRTTINKAKKTKRLILPRSEFGPYKKFRFLNAGDKLIIKYDPQCRYQNAIASVVRPIRKNSRRIVIKTNDGKSWRWPMEWITTL